MRSSYRCIPSKLYEHLDPTSVGTFTVAFNCMLMFTFCLKFPFAKGAQPVKLTSALAPAPHPHCQDVYQAHNRKP